jgi:hypothetical protein
MKWKRLCGAIIWLSAMGVDQWAPHRPWYIQCLAAGLLGLIGGQLFIWDRSGSDD